MRGEVTSKHVSERASISGENSVAEDFVALAASLRVLTLDDDDLNIVLVGMLVRKDLGVIRGDRCVRGDHDGNTVGEGLDANAHRVNVG